MDELAAGTLRNVARNGFAMASTTKQGCEAMKAIDGRMERLWISNMCWTGYYSDVQESPRWVVDLGQPQMIEYVEIFLPLVECEKFYPREGEPPRCKTDGPPAQIDSRRPLSVRLLGRDGSTEVSHVFTEGRYRYCLKGPISVKFVEVTAPGPDRQLGLAEVRAYVSQDAKPYVEINRG
eukprot:tig00020537_g10238.t1